MRLLLVLLLCTSCWRASPRFYAPMFDRGPLTNLGSDAANTNAASHVGWALALPLIGERCAGRKGLWAVGGAWLTFSLVSELWFHAPDGAGPSYVPEFRTDMISRLLPTMGLLSWDLVRDH